MTRKCLSLPFTFLNKFFVILTNLFYRLAAIEENMKMMLKMIEAYWVKCHEACRLLKEKKRTQRNSFTREDKATT